MYKPETEALKRRNFPQLEWEQVKCDFIAVCCLCTSGIYEWTFQSALKLNKMWFPKPFEIPVFFFVSDIAKQFLSDNETKDIRLYVSFNTKTLLFKRSMHVEKSTLYFGQIYHIVSHSLYPIIIFYYFDKLRQK